MTSRERRPGKREHERGSVVILIAALWLGLFGLAALAVDAGFLYQAQRGVQAAADAAVMAGLPTMSTDNARSMAVASGYATGNVTASITGSNLTVNIGVVQPRFFGAIFGVPVKTLHGIATGHTLPSLPAVYALNPSCAGVGVRFDGGTVAITGSMKSAGPMSFLTGPVATTSGPITYAASCPAPVNHGEAFAGGAPTPGPVGPDPLGYTLAAFPVCDCGSLTLPGNLNVGSMCPFTSGNVSGGTLAPGIICANGDIVLGATNVNGNVTFVATGNINVSGTNITFNPAPNGHGLVAFSESNAGDGGAAGCVFPEAISFGSTNWTITGNIYAPNGCISMGGTNVDIGGSLIGLDVDLHGTIGVDSTAGGGGGYYLYQ